MCETNFPLGKLRKRLALSIKAIFVCAKSIHTHGTTRMDFSRCYTNLCTKAEKESISKAGRAVGKYIRTVYKRHESFNRRIITA